NWRGMQEQGVRRIKRALYIDQNSVHFLSAMEYSKLKEFLILEKYLDEKQTELKNFNQQYANNGVNNQRRLTNLGTFRAYIEYYLKNHPGIAQNQSLIVRQLQPTGEGLPIEIYAFTNTTAWVAYEAIQSDIFDHLL